MKSKALVIFLASILFFCSCEKDENNDGPNNTVTDIDGNTYKTVVIGNQIWMAENLKTTHYTDGTPINLVESSIDWEALNYPEKAMCYYNNLVANKDAFGAIYTWAAAKEVCPDGWHLPSDNEWKELEMYLGMSQEDADEDGERGTDEGNKLKSTISWYNDGNGNNSSGFTVIPAGYRYNIGLYSTTYNNEAYFWTSTDDDLFVFCRTLNYASSRIGRGKTNKNTGFSVRCIKN